MNGFRLNKYDYSKYTSLRRKIANVIRLLIICLVLLQGHHGTVNGFWATTPKTTMYRVFRCSQSTTKDKKHYAKQPQRNSNALPSKNGDDENSSLLCSSREGPFTPEYLKDCWGRRPLLVKSAFDTSDLLPKALNREEDDDEDEESIWPTWDDIIQIACDEDGESRLIRHFPGDWESFTLDIGPFEEDELEEIFSKSNNNNKEQDSGDAPPSGLRSTLVVNDVDRFSPLLCDWMEETFSFLPRWRRDDGQVSLAHAGGGIGPHVDNYDVFLIQTQGSRVWEIGQRLISVGEEFDTLVEGIDVRILQHWNEEKSRKKVTRLELKPGDVLYLPPRVAHCGIASSEDCMTLSVGCRAPSASELVSCVAEKLSESITEKAVKRYVDPNLLEDNKNSDCPNLIGTINDSVKNQMKELVIDAVNEILNDDVLWDELVGKVVTETKRLRENYPIALSEADGTPIDEEWNESLGIWGDSSLTVRSVLSGKGVLYQAEGVSFSFSSVQSQDGQFIFHRLFANGEMFEVETKIGNDNVPRMLSCIVRNRELKADVLMKGTDQISSDVIRVLEALVAKGILYGSDN